MRNATRRRKARTPLALAAVRVMSLPFFSENLPVMFTYGVIVSRELFLTIRGYYIPADRVLNFGEILLGLALHCSQSPKQVSRCPLSSCFTVIGRDRTRSRLCSQPLMLPASHASSFTSFDQSILPVLHRPQTSSNLQRVPCARVERLDRLYAISALASNAPNPCLYDLARDHS